MDRFMQAALLKVAFPVVLLSADIGEWVRVARINVAFQTACTVTGFGLKFGGAPLPADGIDPGQRGSRLSFVRQKS